MPGGKGQVYLRAENFSMAFCACKGAAGEELGHQDIGTSGHRDFGTPATKVQSCTRDMHLLMDNTIDKPCELVRVFTLH